MSDLVANAIVACTNCVVFFAPKDFCDIPSSMLNHYTLSRLVDLVFCSQQVQCFDVVGMRGGGRVVWKFVLRVEVDCGIE
jgi:hypothetical protein